MKKVYILSVLSLGIVCFTQCKPAAEDRVKMHENAKRISDSIARVVDQALEEVKIQPSATQPAALPADTNKKAK